MKFVLFFFVLMTVGALAAECDDACTSGYAAFRQWCFTMGQPAPCTSLVNSPRQFTTQSCLRFCVH